MTIPGLTPNPLRFLVSGILMVLLSGYMALRGWGRSALLTLGMGVVFLAASWALRSRHPSGSVEAELEKSLHKVGARKGEP